MGNDADGLPIICWVKAIDDYATYVKRWNGTSWVEEAKLTASDAAAGDYFGGSVALSGDTAVVGTQWDDDAGSAYVFRWNGTSWVEVLRFVGAEAGNLTYFGNRVVIAAGSAGIEVRIDKAGVCESVGRTPIAWIGRGVKRREYRALRIEHTGCSDHAQIVIGWRSVHYGHRVYRGGAEEVASGIDLEEHRAVLPNDVEGQHRVGESASFGSGSRHGSGNDSRSQLAGVAVGDYPGDLWQRLLRHGVRDESAGGSRGRVISRDDVFV